MMFDSYLHMITELLSVLATVILGNPSTFVVTVVLSIGREMRICCYWVDQIPERLLRQFTIRFNL